MVYQELVNYIRAARTSGATDDQVKAALKQIGWKDEDVRAAFDSANALSQKSGIPTTPQVPMTQKPQAGFTMKELNSPSMATAPATKPVAAGTAPQQASRPAIITNQPTAAKPVAATSPATGQPSIQPVTSGDVPLVFSAWLAFWRDPQKTLSRERYYASFGRTMGNLFFSAFLFLGFIAVALIFERANLLPSLPASVYQVAGSLSPTLFSGAVILGALVGAFLFADWAVFASVIYHLVARACGGKGAYSTLAHLLSVGVASTVLAYFVAAVVDLLIICAAYLASGGNYAEITIAAVVALLANTLFFLWLNSKVLSGFTNSQAKGLVYTVALSILHAVVLLAFAIGVISLVSPITLGMVEAKATPATIALTVIGLIILLQPAMLAVSAVMLSLKEANGFRLSTAVIVHLVMVLAFLAVLAVVIGYNASYLESVAFASLA